MAAPGAISRRAFLGVTVLAAGGLKTPRVLAQARPRLVIVGGGAGGVSLARAVVMDSAGGIAVTLVEPNARYFACFQSNLALGGLRDPDSLLFSYAGLAKAGVEVVPAAASAIDRDRREVRLVDGRRLPYDRLALSPGIDLKYDSVPGWGREAEDAMPHAWTGERQFRLLKARLDAVPDGGLIVIIAPPNPSRCPPAPYERASMMAHALKATGRGQTKVIILDPKPKFPKQGLFQEGWEAHYPGMIEWMAPDISEGVRSVDPETGTVVTGFETFARADLVNVIPAQWAGALARASGLTDASGWCPVDPDVLASTVDRNIFIIGDAANAGDMPKSAFAANNQAIVVAAALRSELLSAPADAPGYANTCWSAIARDDVVKESSRYAVADGRIRETETFLSQSGEPADLRRRLSMENDMWYAAMTRGLFG
ncbi:FCSD flavin-binding domain-containing protein [Xanthobacter autotrophicus]|uniref:FCSD flavin-binding domain-containing protein n=1 Tax=Xanthobacter autotrophicus TaxID=280 RepID=UPI0024AB4FFF|nr:NAD(P)/FAD-dependent oxidoreductase [Xanthobacter autotrophicus]